VNTCGRCGEGSQRRVTHAGRSALGASAWARGSRLENDVVRTQQRRLDTIQASLAEFAQRRVPSVRWGSMSSRGRIRTVG
jgi:hypothetical protein